MPAHIRRHKQSGAATRLPSSRLPLGTPQVPDRSQTTSRATNRSTSAESSHITFTPDNTTEFLEEDAINMTNPTQIVMSTAEAKLQRQNERIQLAEAALSNPPNLERSRPQSRAKSKHASFIKSSDDTTSAGRSRGTSISDGGVAIETRVNSYRSEGSHQPRPRTSSSRKDSTATIPEGVGMERQDSVMDDVGFQTYTGRRNGRRGELGAYEDKPEVKQATVEATVDQREILAVFANPLPGLEFLAGQAGWRNGQVQFIQHPNGDVSAHMWSLRSYQWDNIGHFSNIRKKIEGQLAGDHLKGETAYQKLQQNSLAYFRTIAKQREAASTGLDFGQTEIQQLLPELGQGRNLASSGKKLNASTPAFSQGAQDLRLANEEALRGDPTQQPRAVPQPAVSVGTRSFYAVPQGSRVIDERVQIPLSPKHARGAEDPFATSAYPTPFVQLGPEYHGGTVAGPARQSASLGPPQPIDSRRSGYSTYNPIPLPAVPDIRVSYKPLPAARASSSEDVGHGFGSNFYPRSSMPAMPAYYPARVAGTGPETDRRHLSIASMESLRGKPVTPSQAREAMRENLFKISDHAVERSLSRENLQALSVAASEREQSQPSRRTVLHDPFRTDMSVDIANHTSPSISRRSESGDHKSALQMAPCNALFRTTGMPLRWKDDQPLKKAPLLLESILTDSVPDIVDDDYLEPVNRMNYHSYSFNSDPRASYSMQSSVKVSTRSPDQQLQDWWTSGSKFARQEEFYQSIKALSKPSISREVATPRTSTVANPHRSSPVKPEPLTNGDILTRVLIPVYENLASYVQGPFKERRDCFSRWTQAPEWCIDRGPDGNKSFYDDPGQAPALTDRGSRFSSMEGGSRFPGVAVPASLERRLRTSHW